MTASSFPSRKETLLNQNHAPATKARRSRYALLRQLRCQCRSFLPLSPIYFSLPVILSVFLYNTYCLCTTCIVCAIWAVHVWTHARVYVEYVVCMCVCVCVGGGGSVVCLWSQVEDLFYNVPTRRKALTSPTDEFNRVYEVVSRSALARGTYSSTLSTHARTHPHTRHARTQTSGVPSAIARLALTQPTAT